MEKIQKVNAGWEPNSNIKEAEFIMMTKTQEPGEDLTVNNYLFEHMNSYIILKHSKTQTTEIRSRTEKTRVIFNYIGNVFTNTNTNVMLD